MVILLLDQGKRTVLQASTTIKVMNSLLSDKLILGERLYPRNLIIAAVVVSITVAIISRVFGNSKKRNLPPLIPGGWPLLGNLLQLPSPQHFHYKLREWAALHGPIYRLQLGSLTTIVVSSPELVKEVMVTKFESMSTIHMTTAGKILSLNKSMMTGADHGEGHRVMRKLAITNLLGPKAQADSRPLREKALYGMLERLFVQLKGREPIKVDIRKCLREHVFSFMLQQVFDFVHEGVHVPELGRFLTKEEMFEYMIVDFVKAATIGDWRNLFPALSWIPNKSVEDRINKVERNRTWTTNALIEERRKRLKTQAPTKCYADVILTSSEAKNFTVANTQLCLWEEVFAGSDTSIGTSEWIMYRLTIDPKLQERVYNDIKSVVGDRLVTEDDLDKIPLLTAMLLETVRLYTPVPILLPRYVSGNTNLGGYDIPKGTQVMINVYGVNTNLKVWSEPDKWDPYRLLNDKPGEIGVQDFRIASFGGGKRLCPGMLQAHVIIRMFVASLVQHFKFSLVKEDANDHLEGEASTFFTTHKAYPLKIMMTPRVNNVLSTKA